MTPDAPLILIADDESKIRRLTAKGLERAGFDTISAADGLEAMKLLERAAEGHAPFPDLLVLDLMMPGLSGLELLARIRERWKTPVIMLTARDEPPVKMSAFREGADDYLTKPFLMEELEARIRAVLRRTNASAGSKSRVLRSGPLTVDPDRWTAAWRGEPLKLAKREFQLLAALMARPGAVATHEALLRAMGAEDAPDLNALRVGIARLRKRLAEAGMDPAALSSFSGVGYMLGDLAPWDEAELP